MEYLHGHSLANAAKRVQKPRVCPNHRHRVKTVSFHTAPLADTVVKSQMKDVGRESLQRFSGCFLECLQTSLVSLLVVEVPINRQRLYLLYAGILGLFPSTTGPGGCFRAIDWLWGR